MENAGLEVRWAGYNREGGETGLHVTVYTEELVLIEDSKAIAEARKAMVTAADLWPTYRGDATYLAVYLWKDFHEELVAVVGAEAADIESYQDGSTDLDTFVGTWWVVKD
jgi:hypothetical protein